MFDGYWFVLQRKSVEVEKPDFNIDSVKTDSDSVRGCHTDHNGSLTSSS